MLGPVSHRRIRRSIGPYLDDELGPAARAEIARHLAMCWGCNSLSESFRLVKAALRARAERQPTNMGALRLKNLAQSLALHGD